MPCHRHKTKKGGGKGGGVKSKELFNAQKALPRGVAREKEKGPISVGQSTRGAGPHKKHKQKKQKTKKKKKKKKKKKTQNTGGGGGSTIRTAQGARAGKNEKKLI